MSERGGFVGGTRLVCGFLRGNEVNGSSTLFTDSPSSRSFRRAQRKRAKISCKQKEKNVEMKGGITRTFTGKQAQSGNSEKSTSGRQKRKKKKSCLIWANLSGVAIKSTVGLYTKTWQEGPPGDKK